MKKLYLSCTLFLLAGGIYICGTCYGSDRPDARNLVQAPPAVSKETQNNGKYTINYALKGLPVSNILQPTGKFASFAVSGASAAPETEAEIAVNILGPNFIPVRTYLLHNLKSIENIMTLWDGLDMYGKETPGGIYYASLSIVYSDGKKETKFFRFSK
jgi:hypothetical protein